MTFNLDFDLDFNVDFSLSFDLDFNLDVSNFPSLLYPSHFPPHFSHGRRPCTTKKKFTLLHYTLFLLLSPVTIFRKNSLKTELDFYFNNILNRDGSCETVHGSTSSTPNSMWYFISIKFLHSVPSWKPRALNRTRI